MKLSVVTVTLNNLAGLQKTLASLAGQSAGPFEQWVVDGGSTDGTREWLSRHSPAGNFHFLTEKDTGIYDAMNKGTARATGEYVWFLNAGDTCAETTTVENILRRLQEDSTVDVLYGKVWFKSAYGLRSVGAPVTRRDFWAKMPICHQGIIYRRSLLRDFPYPVEYRIISDWIVTRTLFGRGAKFHFLDQHLAIYDLAGLSSRAQAGALGEKLHYEKNLAGKIRVLAILGPHVLGLWLTRKTGIYHLYKKWQHAKSGLRQPPPRPVAGGRR